MSKLWEDLQRLGAQADGTAQETGENEKKRIPLGKKVRFEVFKRDKFTCQYCGSKAPDVVLHVDHIKPVAEGGTNEIMNLVTSCVGCNSGKGARLLDDQSAVERQRRQIEELEERRQQLEMMLQWRESLTNLNKDLETAISDHLGAITGFRPNENGMQDVRRWLRQFPFNIVMDAIDEAFDRYGVWVDEKMTADSWNAAFKKVGAYARSKHALGNGPEISQLAYVQGIIRNRIRDKYFKCLPELKSLHDAGYGIAAITEFAKGLESEDDFHIWVGDWIAHARGAK